MRTAIRLLCHALTAFAVVMLGMVVFSSPASAHQGAITVASTSCQTATGTYQVTFRLSWSNVPSGVTARIHSRTDNNTSFDSGWSYPGGKTWSDRGTTSGANGSLTWTQTLPGSTTTGPWEYAYLAWSNGYDGARLHDTRAEQLGGSCVQTTSLVDDFSLCHATGSASTVEGVRNWVRNNPNDSGQASGHAGPGHQNGLDIIPPIPGVLPHGQNWNSYGQQVHANGCNVPTYVDVNATFTDQRCQANGYVPAAFSAPAYNGITRTVSGLGANGAADPGETVSVTYTGTAATIINGASSNATSGTHTFPVQPSGLRDCVAQPPAETRSVPSSEPSCALGGVSSWVDVYTTPYVWSDAQQTWVLGQEADPGRAQETFAAYGDDEYFQLCAPVRPAAEVRTVPKSSPSCDPAGVTSWNDVFTTEYAWNTEERAWVLGQETGPVTGGETFAAYTDQEFFEACAEAQPLAETRGVPQSAPSCDPAGVTSWNDVFTTEYVWDAGQRAWVLGQEAGPVKADETFAAYTDEEFFEACAEAQPAAETRGVPRSEPSCELGGITRWSDAYRTEYVWDASLREWVPGVENGPDRSGVTFSPYSDEEYFEVCAPAQPEAEERRVPQDLASCELGGIQSWVDVYTSEYVWNAGTRAWEPGEESGPVKAGESFTAYNDDEFYELCAGVQPAAVQRQAAQSVPSCDLAGVARWDDVYTTEHLWNSEARAWELGEETGPVRDGEQFTPYTDAEYFELCAPARPAPIVVEVAGVQASCKIRGTRTWVDVYTTEHEWDAGTRAWELGEESGPVRTDETVIEYTDEELAKACTEAEAGEPPADPAVDDPAAPSVPTVVNAGLGPKNDPSAQSRHPLWFLAMVGGLGLMGFAGLRRRSDGEPVAHDRRAGVSQ